MKKKTGILVVIFVLLILFLPVGLLPRGVMFGGKDYSGKHYSSLIAALVEVHDDEWQIEVGESRLHGKTDVLGVQISIDEEIEEIREKYKRGNVWGAIKMGATPVMIKPEISISDKFRERLRRVSGVPEGSDIMIYKDPETQRAAINQVSLDARLDWYEIERRIDDALVSGKREVRLEKYLADHGWDKQLMAVNERLVSISERPWTIGGLQVSGRDILRYSDISIDIDGYMAIKVRSDDIPIRLRNRLGETQIEYAMEEILRAEMFSGSFGRLAWGADDGPNTRGEYGDYMEVDLSSQKLYLFRGGKVEKSYKISSGKEYKTPPGDYSIVNKIPLAYSTIYEAWMPYWMAFSYQGDVEAWLGVHEIAYHLKDGQRTYPFGDYIGEEGTGGCVALSPGDSKDLYDRVEVGMKILVRE
jgi:hypothetical protein